MEVDVCSVSAVASLVSWETGGFSDDDLLVCSVFSSSFVSFVSFVLLVPLVPVVPFVSFVSLGSGSLTPSSRDTRDVRSCDIDSDFTFSGTGVSPLMNSTFFITRSKMGLISFCNQETKEAEMRH